jgi:hypothetical protein
VNPISALVSASTRSAALAAAVNVLRNRVYLNSPPSAPVDFSSPRAKRLSIIAACAAKSSTAATAVSSSVRPFSFES